MPRGRKDRPKLLEELPDGVMVGRKKSKLRTQLKEIQEAEALNAQLEKDAFPKETKVKKKYIGRPVKAHLARAPLAGVSRMMSDRIKLIVSMEYSGFSDAEIANKLDTTAQYVGQMRIHHPMAFEDARKDHLAEASRQYHMNMYRVKAAISDAGPRAVKTLDEIMSDRENPPGVRSRAAEAILKLLGANERIVMESNVAKEFLNTIKDATGTQEDMYIVDADSEEVVNGNMQ